MDLFTIILLSIIAGWAVNVAADTLPEGRPLRQLWPTAWDWPVRQFAPGGAAEQEQFGWQPAARPRRTALAWGAALGLGLLAYSQWGLTPVGLLTALYGWFFLAVAVIDLEHRRVLNVMLLALLPVAIIASLWLQSPTWQSALAGGLVGFVLFLAVALIRPGGMGMGDVKLAGAIGLVTGLGGVFTALVIGVLAGGVAALYLLLRSRFFAGPSNQAGEQPGKFNGKITMAYAPYLVVGVWVALFW